MGLENTTTGQYICDLHEIDSSSVALVGGKGANLGELTRAELPVPHAFCVTTLAYQKLIDTNALHEPILALLAQIDYNDPAQIEQSATKIRTLIVAAEIPLEIDSAIRNAYSQLESKLDKNVLVSVRSSATAEDLPGTSFAGQQDTYLNIYGADSVIDYA